MCGGFRFIAGLIGGFILLANSAAATQTTATQPRDRETLRIAAHSFPPWIIAEGTAPLRGIDVLIVEQLAQELGLKVEILRCPFARCLKMLEDGAVDLMTGLFRSPEREAFLHFVEPGYLRDPPKVFYLRQKQPLAISQYQDLRGLTIGVIRDSAYFEKFDADTELAKLPLVTDTQLIDMLLKGRIDTFIGTESTVDHLLMQQGKSALFRKAKFQWQSPRYSHLGLSKKSCHAVRLSEFNAAVVKLKQRHFFANLVRDWFAQAGAD